MPTSGADSRPPAPALTVGHSKGPTAEARLEIPVLLHDGTVFVTRPIEPADAAALVLFHAGLSLESTRMRYFSPHPLLSPGEVERFTHVDHHDREALVAIDGADLVGVARYERLPGTAAAEIAFVVADAWHGRGLGSMLMAELAARAREEGIERLVAETMVENRAMVRVFERSGFARSRTLSHGVFHYEFTDLAPPSPSPDDD